MRIIAIACLFLVAGCSWIENSSSELERPTVVGAAAGGVVGASVGGIIGNQSGSTGGGMAIGALTGAGAGALMGSYVEEDRAKAKEYDRIIAEHDATLSQQKEELQKLRSLSGDSFASLDSANYGDARASMRSDLKRVPATQIVIPEHLKARAPKGGLLAAHTEERHGQAARNTSPSFLSQSSSVVTKQAAPQNTSEVYARTQTNTTSVVSRNSEVKEKDLQSPQQPVIPQPILSRQEEQKPAFVVVEPTKTPSEPQVAQGSAIITESGKTLQNEQKTDEQETVSSIASDDCKSAKLEYEKGQQAAESADKLFHYRRALRMCPNDGLFHNALGELYVNLGRIEDARYQFREALRLDPSLKLAQSNLQGLSSESSY